MNIESTEQLRARVVKLLNRAGHGSKTALCREADISTVTLRRFLDNEVETDKDTLPKIREGADKLEAKVGREDMPRDVNDILSDDEFNQIIFGLPARLIAAGETLQGSGNFRRKFICLKGLLAEITQALDDLDERLELL